MNKKILAAISLLLVFSFVFAFAGCSSEEPEEETTTILRKTDLPLDITTSVNDEGETITQPTYTPEQLAANTKTIFEYFDVNVNALKASEKVGVPVNVSLSQGIGKAKDENGEDRDMSENAYINAAISSLSDYMLPGYAENEKVAYSKIVGEFDANALSKDVLPLAGMDYVSALTLEDVKSATCSEEGEIRTIIITLNTPVAPEVIEKAYTIGNIDAVYEEFDAKAANYMVINKEATKTEYKDCEIIITTNVKTDAVLSIEYVKRVDIDTEVTGKGTLESVGTLPVCFRYENRLKYEFDRAEETAE